MSSAFDDPPDSGEKGSPRAAGAAIRNARSAAARTAKSRRRGMPEGKTRGSYLRVQPSLEIELAVEVAVEHAVQRELRARVRAGGARRQPCRKRLGLRQQAVVGMHVVDETPLERPAGIDPLAEQ